MHRHVRYSCIYAARMSPALNRSSALQRFKRGNTIEKRNGMMFNFNPELPHVYLVERPQVDAFGDDIVLQVLVGC